MEGNTFLITSWSEETRRLLDFSWLIGTKQSILDIGDSGLFGTTMCRVDMELKTQVLQLIFDEDEFKKISPSNHNKASLVKGTYLLYCLLQRCSTDMKCTNIHVVHRWCV